MTQVCNLLMVWSAQRGLLLGGNGTLNVCAGACFKAEASLKSNTLCLDVLCTLAVISTKVPKDQWECRIWPLLPERWAWTSFLSESCAGLFGKKIVPHSSIHVYTPVTTYWVLGTAQGVSTHLEYRRMGFTSHCCHQSRRPGSRIPVLVSIRHVFFLLDLTWSISCLEDHAPLSPEAIAGLRPGQVMSHHESQLPSVKASRLTGCLAMSGTKNRAVGICGEDCEPLETSA